MGRRWSGEGADQGQKEVSISGSSIADILFPFLALIHSPGTTQI